MKGYLAIIAVVLYILYVAGSERAPEPATAAPAHQERATVETQSIGMITWAEALANDLGNDAPSPEIVRWINAWIRAEGSAAAYNPLATSQPMPGSTRYNADNVQNFLSIEDGLAATVITLRSAHDGYADIAEGIRTNDVPRAHAGLERSPWGTQAGDVAAIYNGPDSTEAPETAPPSAPDNQAIRAQVIGIALSQLGHEYVLGTEGPDTFDCSGLMQWSYAQIGIGTTRTTFTQLDYLRVIQPEEVQPGDLVYFQYSWDQHVGMLADVDGDGTWDMIHAAAPGIGVTLTNDVFSDPFYADAIIGYRTAL